MDTHALSTLAQEAARLAGDTLKRYRTGKLTVTAKSAHHDLVTDADIEAERTIVARIRAAFPEHNILAEEGSYPSSASDYRWIIDPLDGTNNFAKGVPLFTVSIAVQRGFDLVCGVVYDPMRDEMFHACRGEGAFLNRQPIHVSEVDRLKQAMLFTGFHYDRGKDMLATLDAIGRFFRSGIIGIRRTGSAALDLAYVAAGRCDGFWEHMLQPWDTAAGTLLVREAGGRVTDRMGVDIRPRAGYTVASNGRIHDHMLAVIGSGPSLLDEAGDVHYRQSHGP